MRADELTAACSFQTERLEVSEWHNLPSPGDRELSDVLTQLLTPATTRPLPSAWHGRFDKTRAIEWIRERDAESPTLMVLDRKTGVPVGLMILSELPCDRAGSVDVRLGYLLAESAWGRGLGTELVAGFVAWCRSEPRIRSVTGGVALDNPASARVLTNNGFTTAGTPNDEEQFYELVLTAGQVT